MEIVLLSVVWCMVGFACYAKPFRTGESMMSDSWKSVGEKSRETGFIGAADGVVVAVLKMVVIIGLGGLSWFFWWLANKEEK